MQVILLHDVAKIGRRYAVVEVPDGYARNKLIPMKAAVPATKDMLARYATQRERAAATKEAEGVQLATSLATLKDTGVTVTVSGNDKGHLFKAVTKDEVAAACAAAGAPVPASAIIIKNPIKAVGPHTVTVQQGTVTGSVVVMVAAA